MRRYKKIGKNCDFYRFFLIAKYLSLQSEILKGIIRYKKLH